MTANDPDLAAMRRAVAAMKALPQSDPRNWIRFADIHRNFCPHGNWYFLPWHRAYILVVRAHLPGAVGQARLRAAVLELDRRPAIPGGVRGRRPQLQSAQSSAARRRRGLRLADDMVGPQVISRIMKSPDFEAFGSTRPRGQNSAAAQWQRRARLQDRA